MSTERVVWPLVSAKGEIAFVGYIPNTDVCTPQGRSRFYVLNYGTGQSVIFRRAQGGGRTRQPMLEYSGNATGLQTVNVRGKVEIVISGTPGDTGGGGGGGGGGPNQLSPEGELLPNELGTPAPRVLNWRFIGE